MVVFYRQRGDSVVTQAADDYEKVDSGASIECRYQQQVK